MFTCFTCFLFLQCRARFDHISLLMLFCSCDRREHVDDSKQKRAHNENKSAEAKIYEKNKTSRIIARNAAKKNTLKQPLTRHIIAKHLFFSACFHVAVVFYACLCHFFGILCVLFRSDEVTGAVYCLLRSLSLSVPILLFLLVSFFRSLFLCRWAAFACAQTVVHIAQNMIYFA